MNYSLFYKKKGNIILTHIILHNSTPPKKRKKIEFTTHTYKQYKLSKFLTHFNIKHVNK